MPRYFIRISYKGTQYHGWQVQPNAVTVQEKLNHALSTLFREQIETLGAGRTDSFVHASYFIAHFNTSKVDITDNPYIIHKINCILPTDITAYSIKPVSDATNARFDAISRTYNYFIHTSKSSFINEFSYHFKGVLNVDDIKKAIPTLFNHTDFTSFSKLHTDVKTNNCKIEAAEWIEYAPDQYVFVIKADRFLRNMVRAIMGTLIDIGKGKVVPEQLDKIISCKNRSLAGTSAPPQGLFLANIEYPESVYKEDGAIEEYFPRFVL